MKPVKALVAEDHHSLREIALYNLEHYGDFEFVAVGNGDAAVAEVLRSEFDVVLMDIRMPVMDGIEATRRIRMFSKVPIVAVSAYDDATTRGKAKAAGVNAFFAKPVDFSRLAIAIRRLTQKHGTDSLDERARNVKELITNHRRRLHILRDRQAKMGSETPPSVVIEIQDIESHVDDLQGLLNE